MNTVITKLLTLGKLLINKGALILVALILGQFWIRQNGLPFGEVLYLVSVVFGVFIAALALRFLFFPEAAEFAEDAEKFTAALSSGKYPFAMTQYRFATAICFSVPTVIAIAVFR